MSTLRTKQFVERLEATPQATMHLGLDVMRDAVVQEGLTRPASTVVIVAGTNGKGTVSAALSQLCTQRGWTTTLLTSPHLVDVRERIRINGAPITPDALLELGEPILQKYGAESQHSPRPLTYFELTVLLGLRAAQHVQSDVLIMEVGLGGRLDATNTIDADLSVFTSISLDHTDLLGDTIEKIAYEKSCVARQGRPAIVHPELAGSNALSACLDAIGAPIVHATGGTDARTHNFALAAAAFSWLEARTGQHASDAFIDAVLADFQWPGRQEWTLTPGGTRVLLDGAHNRASSEELEKVLMSYAPLHPIPAVLSISGARTIEDIVQPVARFVRTWHVCAPSFERAIPTEILVEQLRAWELDDAAKTQRPPRNIRVHTTVEAALEAAEQECIDHALDGLLIFGSLYLIAEVYTQWWADDDRALSLSRSGAKISWQPSDKTSVLGHATPRNAPAFEGGSLAVSAQNQPTNQGFLRGEWFPDDMDAARPSRRIAYPRATATAAAFTAIVLMTIASLSLPGSVPIYARLAVGTLVGNGLPALVLLLIFRLPWDVRPPSLRLAMYALWMGVIFSLTGTFLTGFLNEVYTWILSGTAAEQWWDALMDSREASYENILNPKGLWALLAAFFAVSISPGIFEEFLFRGALYRVMERVVVWRRVLFLGALFSFIHFDIVGFIPLLMLGALLTWLRALSGTWMYSVLVHIAFNATALGLSLAATQAEQWTESSIHGADELSLTPLIVLLSVSAVYSWYLFRQIGRNFIFLKKLSPN